jgi:predicted transcriptional regulator
MKKHNGMRPQDVALLLAIASLKEEPWQMKQLSEMTGISRGEVSESLNRSAYGGLLSGNKSTLYKLAFFDLLEFGLRHIFPVHPGEKVKGVPTAISASPLNKMIVSNVQFVWPSENGDVTGFAIESLYKTLPEFAVHYQGFYELLALTDALRFGKNRERILAMKELKLRIGGK